MESAQLGVKFRPKPSKSKIYCSVFGCSSKACKNPELSFHHFPRIGKIKVNHVNKLGEIDLIDRRLLWERVLRMPRKLQKVCESVDFILNKITTQCLHFI